ncbi:MAG: isoprenylcysteine carboxylmethyltransferase family protein [Pseudomonadota bacterium]
MSVRRDFPDLPPIWALGTLVVQWVLARFLPILTVATGPLGWLFVALGFGLALWSLVWFRRKNTTFEPRDQPTALIVEGPFRVNRNPIYTGLALILVGTGLLFGSLLAVALVLPFCWIITRRFILDEEATLRATFGETADAYIAATRRW